MLHLTGPHLWLLSPPLCFISILWSLFCSSGLQCVCVCVCDTHFPSQCRVVVVILCFSFLVSLWVALFLPFQPLSRRCLLTSSQIKTQRRPWARGPEYTCVCMCVCVCVGTNASHLNAPLCILCVELHVFVSVFYACVTVCVCVSPAAVYSCMAAAAAAAGFRLLLPLKAAAHCYSELNTQINKQS